MSKHHLGEFEEIVMLTVAILHDEAYGIAIIEEMESRLGRKVSIGALQTVLRRLENKGYLSSRFGEATKVRGGKRKRIYNITQEGQAVLREMKDIRAALWDSIALSEKPFHAFV